MTDRDHPEMAFNLDALVKEAGAAEDVQFTYLGRRWRLRHLDALDGWEAVDIFGNTTEGGNGIRMLEAAFGPAQWAEFREASKGKITKKGLDLLGEHYVRSCGIEPGESQASSR